MSGIEFHCHVSRMTVNAFAPADQLAAPAHEVHVHRVVIVQPELE